MSNEYSKTEREQGTELNSEGLRAEVIRTEINKIVFENYWKPIEILGQHVIAMSVELISVEIQKRYGGDKKEIMKIVLESILESPSPEDLESDAVNVLADAVRSGEHIIIWTLGDEGAYSDDESKIYYPAYDLQKKKVDGSKILSKLDEALPQTQDRKQDASQSVALSISARDKHDALRDSVIKFSEMGVRHVYVVDDRQENLDMISGVSQEVGGGPQVHDFRINSTHPEGTLTAFRRYISERRSEHLLRKERTGLILDWDNTLYNEERRVRRSAQLIADKILKIVLKYEF